MEHETKYNIRIFYSTHVWVAEWSRHLTSIPLMVGVVSSIPTAAGMETTLFFCWNFLKPLDVKFVQKYQKCQICIENEILNTGHTETPTRIPICVCILPIIISVSLKLGVRFCRGLSLVTWVSYKTTIQIQKCYFLDCRGFRFQHKSGIADISVQNWNRRKV